MALIEKGLDKGIVPDEVVFLKDTSENGDYLLKRWYRVKRKEIDARIQKRLDEEDRERRRREEEEARRVEEERKKREEEEARRLQEEQEDRMAAGEEMEGEPRTAENAWITVC